MKKLFLSLAVFVIAGGEAGAFADPNLIAWYKFDETAPNNIAHDSSGYGHDGFVDGPGTGPNWDPDDGHCGRGSLAFDNDTAVILPGALLSDINEGITISVWLKDAYRQDGSNWVFDAGLGAEAEYRVQIAIVTQPERRVLWRAGNDTNDVLTWDLSGRDPNMLEGWHFWVFIKDERAGGMGIMGIYFDPVTCSDFWPCRVASKVGVDKTLVNVRNSGSKIGAVTYHDNDFVGKMDDFRIFDRALSEREIGPGLGRGVAWLARPRYGRTNVSVDAKLSWRPGDLAGSHDLYLGTNYNDVCPADTTSGVFIRNQEPNEYDPCGLESDTTYYWRIDEVNDSNGYKWKGAVWRFTTAGYVGIDDFEQYDNQNDHIYYTWDDGQINGSGSYIDLGLAPGDPVYEGEQSMLCVYNTSLDWGYGAYVSEVSRLVNFTNWNSLGLKVLTFYFYGAPANDANETEELYAGVEDGSFRYAEARYGDEGHDNKDLQEAEWHAWDIPLSRFTDGGADLNDVERIYLGLGDRTNNTTPGTEPAGLVFFDEIRLHRPRCVPEEAKPLADLNDDCVVDYKDLKIMAAEWLCSGSCAADLYPDSRTNLKDCAVLVSSWLEQELWPAQD
ncbi:MAG: LamG-like jellyroll fold domain-containing protein [Planctomycetota bacterium]|jgi:hypothetical protein